MNKLYETILREKEKQMRETYHALETVLEDNTVSIPDKYLAIANAFDLEDRKVFCLDFIKSTFTSGIFVEGDCKVDDDYIRFFDNDFEIGFPIYGDFRFDKVEPKIYIKLRNSIFPPQKPDYNESMSKFILPFANMIEDYLKHKTILNFLKLRKTYNNLTLAELLKFCNMKFVKMVQDYHLKELADKTNYKDERVVFDQVMESAINKMNNINELELFRFENWEIEYYGLPNEHGIITF
jgi:hypothetical protein